MNINFFLYKNKKEFYKILHISTWLIFPSIVRVVSLLYGNGM